MVAAVAEVHAASIAHVAVTALRHDEYDGSLLALSEAWARESSDGELVQDRRSRHGWIVLLIVVGLAKQYHESADAAERSVEQHITLAQENMIDRIPRVLVDGGDQALVDADRAALSEWRLGMVSLS